MDQMRRLICTVGLPRSGKTTWTREQKFPIVSPDSIRLAMHGQRFATNAEQLVWAFAKIMVRCLFLAGHNHVILDATNVTKKRRDEWLSKEWVTYFKHINTPASVCLERAITEGDTEIQPVIARMAYEFEHLENTDLIWID